MRIFADAVLLLAVYLVPWWFALLAASVFSFFFRNYFELPLAGFMIDEIYGVDGRFPFDFRFAAFAFGIILFFVIRFLRRNLSFY